jgi:hypothetical protein
VPWINFGLTAIGDLSFMFGGKEAFIAGKLAWGERQMAGMFAKDAARGMAHAALAAGYRLAATGAISRATIDRFGVGMTNFGGSYILEQPDNAGQLAMQDQFRISDFVPGWASKVAWDDARACSR